MFGRSPDAVSVELTRFILQPIVADRQQLIRATRPTTLQPMVATTKDAVKVAFSARLHGLLDDADAPERGRAQWLADKFRDPVSRKNAFSRESARKWLSSESIPDQAHISMLCTSFGWSVDYLQSGVGPKYAGQTDPDLAELIDGWRLLDQEGRRHLMRQFRNERDMHGMKPAPSTTTPTHPGRKGRHS